MKSPRSALFKRSWLSIFVTVVIIFQVTPKAVASSPHFSNDSQNSAVGTYLKSPTLQLDLSAIERLATFLGESTSFDDVTVHITDEDVVGGHTDLYTRQIELYAVKDEAGCNELRFRQVLTHELGHLVFVSYLRGKSQLTDDRFAAHIAPANETEAEADARYDKISAFDAITPAYGELAADIVKTVVLKEPGLGLARDFSKLSPVILKTDYDDVHTVFNSTRRLLWERQLSLMINDEAVSFAALKTMFNKFQFEIDQQGHAWHKDPHYLPDARQEIETLNSFIEALPTPK